MKSASQVSKSSTPTRHVRCPACGGQAVYGPQNPWRPFCGERCRNHDLGAWASEDYRVAAQEPPDEEPPASVEPSGRPSTH